MDQNIRELISKCIEGDSAAQRAFYDKYKGRFYAVCLRYASGNAEAQDIMIEAFLKVFNSLKTYRGDSNIEGWMYKIFSNYAISYVNKKHKDVMSPQNTEEISENMLSDKSTAFADDTRNSLLHYLQCLNPRERTVFNMIAIEEYTLAEVADELHIKKAVAKTYYYRARATLQKMIEKNEKELMKEYNIKQ